MVSWDVEISSGFEQVPFGIVAFAYLAGALLLTGRWCWRVLKLGTSPWKANVILLLGIAIYCWLRGAFLATVAIQKSCDLSYLQLPFVVYVMNKAVLIRMWGSFLGVAAGRSFLELDVSVGALVVSSLVLLGLAISSFFDNSMLIVSEYVNLIACSITGLALLRLSWLLKSTYENSGRGSICSFDTLESRAVFATTTFGTYTIGRSLLIVLIVMGKEGLVPGLSSDAVNNSQWWWTPLFYAGECITIALCVGLLLDTPQHPNNVDVSLVEEINTMRTQNNSIRRNVLSVMFHSKSTMGSDQRM